MEYIIILVIAFVLTVIIVYIKSKNDIIVLNKGYEVKDFVVMDANEEFTLLKHIKTSVKIVMPTPTRCQYKIFYEILSHSTDLIAEAEEENEIVR